MKNSFKVPVIEPYKLEKSIWTEQDFPVMGWHDGLIYGLAYDVNRDETWKNELYFDIDYIFQWVDPQPPSSHFTFWTAPCTLIFKNYYDLKIDLDASYTNILEIDNITLVEKLENEHNHKIYYSWDIKLQSGLISLKSESYTQIVRNKPVYLKSQWLNLEERGGISFSKTPCQN